MDKIIRIKQNPKYPVDPVLIMDNLSFRQATIRDLPVIIRLLADDFLGAQRERLEDPLPDSYIKAFREIDADPNNELIVAEVADWSAGFQPATNATAFGTAEEENNPNLIKATASHETDAGRETSAPVIIGTLQLIFIPSLSYQGGMRCTVESVRVDDKLRGKGIGREMMLWAIERAKQKGCISMQLTSHNDRVDAHRFYEKLGFKHSHVGMKLALK